MIRAAKEEIKQATIALPEIFALHAATRVVRHSVAAYNRIKKINHKASGSSFICPPWCGYRVKSLTVWPFNLVVFLRCCCTTVLFFSFFFIFVIVLNPVQLLDFCFCFTAGRRSTSIHSMHWNPEIFSPHHFISKLYCFRVFFWTNSERNPPTNTTPCSLSASVFSNCLPHSGRTVAVYGDYFMFSLCGCLLE